MTTRNIGIAAIVAQEGDKVPRRREPQAHHLRVFGRIDKFIDRAAIETGRVEMAKPRDDGQFWFSGWARNPRKHAAADYVVLGWAGPDNSFHPFTAIPTGRVKSEVAEVYGPLSRKAGFDQEMKIPKLPPPGVTIKAWAIDWEAQQAFPMEGAIQLTRPGS